MERDNSFFIKNEDDLRDWFVIGVKLYAFPIFTLHFFYFRYKLYVGIQNMPCVFRTQLGARNTHGNIIKT